MTEETLPGTDDGAAGERRIVLHVDMDCFYASCERLRDPALVGEPVVVGMGYEDGETIGAVATASYEARAFGVESAQAISTALDRLPRIGDAAPGADAGHYRPVDMEFYESVAADVKAILRDCADAVREVSIDEAYLDVTDRTAWRTVGEGGAERSLAEGYARHVKERIDREVGVPASVGVAPTMSTAKIASDFDKPDGLVTVRPDEVRSFLDPIPVAAVHGVGPVTARELGEMGIETAGDLAAADPAALEARFGGRGRELYERARGEDDREVTPTGRPKSLSRESAFASPTAAADPVRERIRALATDVAERARGREALYRTIGIKVVVPPFDVSTRARSLPGPVDDPDLVEEVALDLFEEFEGARVRKLGVRVSNLSFSDADQSRLDGWEGAGGRGGDASGGGRPDPDGGAPTLDAWADADPNADAGADADVRRDESAGGADGPSDGQAALSDFERGRD